MILLLLTLLLTVAAGDALVLQQSKHHRHRSIFNRRTSLKELLLNQAFNRYSDQILDPSGGDAASHSFIAQNVTWTTYPFNPTGIPLAVRSPYVSTWLWGGANDRGGNLATQFATFWNGNNLPWCGTLLVDGITYTWMGVPSLCSPDTGRGATQLSLNFTSTSTTFVMRAGPVDVSVQFLSPITPKDMVRQTLPYSYMHVGVSSNDGQEHPVKLYSDLTAEWASNDHSKNVTWGQYVVNNSIFVQYAQLVPEQLYAEEHDSSSYGQVVWATDMVNTTSQSGPSSSLRAQFMANGRLSSSPDTAYRAINNNQPAFGFAKDLGIVGPNRLGTATFSVGHYRDPAVFFPAARSANPERSLYFMSAYPSLQSSVGFFHNDYIQASVLSQAFDAQVSQAANAISADYAGLCAISARQVFSGVEITVGKTGSGYNTSDVMMWVKEIATSNYVNTVDVMSPAWPFFAYINPEMIRWMLVPVIEYSEAVFPHPWAPHDIGEAYPNATGAFQVDAPYYIEESANMLFMALAYTRFSGKSDLISSHYKTFKQWADFLVNATVAPALQASTDDFAGELANMTSLAIKGVVGIGCMSRIATALGNTVDATYYLQTAQAYSNRVITLAMASTGDHLKLTYQSSDDSWSMLYNLLPDKVFGLQLFSDSFYTMQGNWYAAKANRYGVPLDSRSANVKTDFALWTAAIYASNSTLRDVFIRGARDFLAYGSTGQAFPDLYNSVNASSTGFVNRPVIGGVYALLAQSELVPSSSSSLEGSAVAAASVTTAKDVAVVTSVAPLFTVAAAVAATANKQDDANAAQPVPLQATASSAATRRILPFWRR